MRLYFFRQKVDQAHWYYYLELTILYVA